MIKENVDILRIIRAAIPNGRTKKHSYNEDELAAALIEDKEINAAAKKVKDTRAAFEEAEKNLKSLVSKVDLGKDAINEAGL